VRRSRRKKRSALRSSGQSVTSTDDTVVSMRNVLVTGPSSGIGKATAFALSRLGFHVIAAGRSPQRVGELVDQIIAEGGSAEYLPIDLTSLTSARTAARMLEDSGRSLDVLINNAGVGVTRGITEDGFQLQFGVNHLGHFMLTEHLRRTFRPGTRIVSVSSHMHYRAATLDFEAVTRKTTPMGGIEAYSQSKLANVLFTRELARRQPDWRTFAVHPGVVDTGIFPSWTRPVVRSRSLTPEEGAVTVVWCATDPGLEASSGGYFASQRERQPSDVALDDDLAHELWSRSERWCGLGPVD